MSKQVSEINVLCCNCCCSFPYLLCSEVTSYVDSCNVEVLQTPYYCSISVDWRDLAQHLQQFDRQVIKVNGNGFCFLKAVRACLLIDYQEDIPVEKLMNQLYERVNYYSNFHQGGIWKLLKDAKKFIKKRKYRLAVVDVCIAATANVLKVNLYISEKINNKVQLIKHKCSCVDTDKTIYLCYSHTTNIWVTIMMR